MASEKSQSAWLEKILRLAEIGLIFGTVYLMYLGYQLQRDANKLTLQGFELQDRANKLQNRPYLFLSTEKTELNKVSEREFEWTVYLKNTSNFPALNVRSYGLLIADGTLLYGLYCRPSPSDKNRAQFESKEACSSSFPTVDLPMQNIRVCVNNNLPRQSIYPGSEVPMNFRISKQHFDKISAAQDKGKSGMFFTLTYQGLNSEETYVSRLGLLPYEDQYLHTYRFKIFALPSK